jgi:hypothetical protein
VIAHTAYSEHEIVTSKEGDDSVITFRLDRVAGTYFMEVRSKIDKNSGIEEWGKCTVVSSEQKF